jgi:putative transposase
VILEMKDTHSAIGLARLCRLLGVTRQAFYQHFWYVSDTSTEEELVLEEVYRLRTVHPAIGGRKLYYLLQPFLVEHQIKIGRDALFNLLSVHKLLVRKRRRRINTTLSRHWLRKYPNLIKNWSPSKANQLWVSDITYIPVRNGFLYLSLITDSYSHKVMGYSVASNLEAINTINALKMALTTLTEPPSCLIHHSDRGIQYCSSDYVNLLNQHNIQISMSENGDPLENPVAERINGILKNEYIIHYTLVDLKHTQELIADVVNRYNKLRPHETINMMTPEEAHHSESVIIKSWSQIKKSLTL